MERNEGSAQRCRSVIEDTLIIFFLNSVMITSFGLGFKDLEVFYRIMTAENDQKNWIGG